MLILKTLVLAMVLALSACGGATSSTTQQSITISLYGDSYTPWGNNLDKELQKYNQNIKVNVLSTGGATTTNAINGTLVHGTTPLQFGNLREQFAGKDPADLMVIRYGVADAVLQDHSTFCANMLVIAGYALEYKRRVVFANIPDVKLQVLSTARLQQQNQCIAAAATKAGAYVIDLFNNPKLKQVEIDADGLHPTVKGYKQIDVELAKEIWEYLR